MRRIRYIVNKHGAALIPVLVLIILIEILFIVQVLAAKPSKPVKPDDKSKSFAITNISKTNDDFYVTWESKKNQRYRVMFTTNLNSVFMDVSGEVTAISESTTFVMTNVTYKTGYFKVVNF